MSSSKEETPSSESSNKQSSSSGHSGGTLPPSSQESEEEEKVKFWGQLVSLNEELFRKFNFENHHKKVVFGRGLSCDYVFKAKENDGGIGLNTEGDGLKLNQVSTRHFQIIREIVNQQSCIYITDLSSNGTFVNDEKILKNVNCPLNNGDKISIVLAKYVAFMFVDCELAERTASLLPYELKRKYVLEPIILGTGSVGSVHRGYVKGSCDKVAIKVIENKTNSLVFTDVKYEANILSKLNHTNIVNFLDVFETENASKVYIVLEYVSGGDLFTRIKENGRISECLAKLWFEQILNAIAYLHGENIIHRDLKPENILIERSSDNVEENFTMKVADFNLSRFVSHESLARTQVGTPMYIAPEILDPMISEYDFTVDCWSLGCILFVMLGGYTPFNPNENLAKDIMKGRICFVASYWEKISLEAVQLVKSLMKVDSTKRITITGALQHNWLAPSTSSSVKRSVSDNQTEKEKRMKVK